MSAVNRFCAGTQHLLDQNHKQPGGYSQVDRRVEEILAGKNETPSKSRNGLLVGCQVSDRGSLRPGVCILDLADPSSLNPSSRVPLLISDLFFLLPSFLDNT